MYVHASKFNITKKNHIENNTCVEKWWSKLSVKIGANTVVSEKMYQRYHNADR